MSEITEEHNDNRAVAILKPQYLLAVAVIGLALTVANGFQPQFGFMGMVGLSLLGLSIVTWGIIAPEQLRAAITGRTARYGGTSFVVTVALILALIALYVLMRGLNFTFDITERDAFSVRPEIRESLVQIVGNTDTPDLQLVTFLTAEDAGLRDRLTLLYDDILTTTLGKVSYQFIDIDQQPLLADQYGVSGSQQIAVTPLDGEGNPIPSLANIIPRIDTATLQTALLAFITTQNLEGSFGAYFVIESGGLRLDVTDGSGMTFLSDDLRTIFRFDTLLQGAMSEYRQSDDIQINTSTFDGEAMIIAGGSDILSEEDRLFLQDYLDGGGSLVLMSGFNFEGNPTLATDPELTSYLLDKFGIAFNDDFIIDPVLAYQGTDVIAPNAINTEHFIGQMVSDDSLNVQFLFGFPTASIQTADDPPTDVLITPLIQTSASAYAMQDSDLPAFLQSETLPEPDQAIRTGTLTIASVAENQRTGARIVLIGNDTLAVDRLTDLEVGQQLGIANRELLLRSILWASHFDTRVANLEQPMIVERPSEQVLIATEEEISTINGLLGLVLPFAVLGLGVLVVFLNREREQE